MKLWNREYSPREIERHAGDVSQIMGVRRSVMDDGPARGMRALDVRTGGGLSFTILPDRGMDIGWCELKGVPLGFISKTGAVAPWLCEYPELGFLRGFTGGLLTTCGYTHMGAPSVDGGEKLGQHGRATLAPADQVGVTEGFEGGAYVMRARGVVRESRVFGEHIRMTRVIEARGGENKIVIADEVRNHGFASSPLMMLYHVNFGHPLIGAGARLVLPDGMNTRARDDAARAGIARWSEMEGPQAGYAEQVFYHEAERGAAGLVTARVENGALGVYASVTYDLSQLPKLIEWKQMGEGDYALGVEPGTWYPEGRASARERGELCFIEPGETQAFRVEVEAGEL